MPPRNRAMNEPSDHRHGRPIAKADLPDHGVEDREARQQRSLRRSAGRERVLDLEHLQGQDDLEETGGNDHRRDRGQRDVPERLEADAPSSRAARRTSAGTSRSAPRNRMARSGIARHVTATSIATRAPGASLMTTGGRPTAVSRYVAMPVRGSNISRQKIPSAIGATAQGRRRTRASRPAKRPRPWIRSAVASASGTASAEVTRQNQASTEGSRGNPRRPRAGPRSSGSRRRV